MTHGARLWGCGRFRRVGRLGAPVPLHSVTPCVGGHGASGLRHARTCTEAPGKHPEVPPGTHVWRHTVAVRAEAALGPHCGVDGGEGGSGNEGKSLCTVPPTKFCAEQRPGCREQPRAPSAPNGVMINMCCKPPTSAWCRRLGPHSRKHKGGDQHAGMGHPRTEFAALPFTCPPLSVSV